jgi:hypothetical protein
MTRNKEYDDHNSMGFFRHNVEISSGKKKHNDTWHYLDGIGQEVEEERVD